MPFGLVHFHGLFIWDSFSFIFSDLFILFTFLDSPWYVDIIFILQNLQAPPGLSRTKNRFLKMKASKFVILDNILFWKNDEGILLNSLLKEEANNALQEIWTSCLKCQIIEGKRKLLPLPLKPTSIEKTFSTRGSWLHWRNSSTLFWPTQMDTLFHKMYRSHSL